MALRYLSNFISSEAFKTAGREVTYGVPRLVNFLCCLQLTKTHLLTVVLTYGPSMLPTLGLTGNLCLAERISTRFEKLGVGDVVLLRSPDVPKKIVTKRLVAVEGQSVTYIVDPKNSDRSETVVVPKGHVWVEGDNIYESNDSRKFGPVPYGLLQGRVFWRIWPPKDFGSLVQSKGKDSVS
ncbi:mitochondrial ATP-independent inner membrane protease subunit 1a-like [Rosa sericea]